MIQVSDTFAELIDSASFRLQLTLGDGTAIPKQAIKSAEWSGGSNAGDDITLGSTVAIKLTVTLDRETLGNIDLADAELTATLAMDISEEPTPLPIGKLQVTDDDSDDDTVTISAGDAMLWAFSTEYALDDESLGFDWEIGVDGETLLQAICNTCGVTLRTTGLRKITLSNVSPSGYTYREVIAFLACMWGCFARMDGSGQLVLQWYADVDRPVTASRYYSGELSKADYSYTIGYIKCYAEPLEETFVVGNAAKPQGIYIKCPWMTPECLQEVWETIGGFTYRPVSELRFLGDPRLEPGDVLQVTDRDGTTYTVPCMTLRHEFDGGIITEVTAVGKSSSASGSDYQGPVTRQIERAVKKIKASLIKYEDRIEAKVEAVAGDVAALEINSQEIEARVEGAEGDIAYLELAAQEIEARVQDNEGNISQLELNAREIEARVEDNEGALAELILESGQVAVTVRDGKGTLNTTMDSTTWEAIYRTLSGETKSGFYFDFALGRFVYDGTGVYRSEDGSAYIQIENDGISVYADDGTGDVAKKMHIGFNLAGGVAYPYILLGAPENVGEAGIVKKFTNGLFIGNGYAADASGAFSPAADYAGIFVNTKLGKTYVVNGTSMKDVYAGAEGEMTLTSENISHEGDKLSDRMPVCLTQAEYDALVAAGTYNEDTPYLIKKEA